REAEAAYRKVLLLERDLPEAHCNLGHALRNQGRFADALASLRKGHELGRKHRGWPYPSAQWVAQCNRLIELDRKLPDIVSKNARPASAGEALEFAVLCQHPAKRLHASAVRLAAAAFTDRPKLADDLRKQHRYNAACSAALAAAGLAEDAKNLPDAARKKLRQQALAWLRGDLAVYAK